MTQTDTKSPPLDAAGCRALAAEIESALQRHILDAWFPRSVDARGGFFEDFREDWSPGPDGVRSLVHQARLTWVAARAARRDPPGPYRATAWHGLDFLEHRLWDADFGGFFWNVAQDGGAGRGGEKCSYGIAFGIYAAAAVFEASHDPRALHLARRAFGWLETHGHDGLYGGYHEAAGSRYGDKAMHTHLHLLEAFCALYAVWPDAGVRTRIQELLFLVRDRMTANPPGTVYEVFTPDWRPVSDAEKYGHVMEAAFLLTEAAAVGPADGGPTWAVARALVDHALERGWDETWGGFYDTGGASGAGLRTRKVWWVQAEALNALLRMHRRFGRETPRYGDVFRRQWDFIRRRQTDHTYGGWHAAVSREGEPPPGRAKSDAWTDPYHQARALFTVAETLRAPADGKESRDDAHR